MGWIDTDTVWAALAADWILADTADWVGLDKPTDVACPPGVERLAAAGPAVRNDVCSRLRLHWQQAAAPAPALPMACVFDPLDGRIQPQPGAGSAVSGVVVVARRAEIAEALTRHELQGQVRLTCVAGVHGWPADLPQHRERRAALNRQLAALGVTLKNARTVGTRTLLTLQYPSGRCLDVQRELEALGLKLAGPHPEAVAVAPYPPAARLMLHRGVVDMPLATLEAPLPAAFGRWLQDEADPPFDERLDAALRRRFELGRSDETTAFRLLDSAGDDIALDRYGPDLVLHRMLDLPQGPASAKAVAAGLSASVQMARHVGERLRARSVYLKLRPRQANTVVDAVAAGLAPSAPVFGMVPPAEAGEVVYENGLRYRVRLGQGLGTGIYLDQRENRRWLLEHSAGLRVLNTFAYTCAFSVAAAAGGAARTVSVDAAANALEAGRANLELNGVTDTTRHDLIRGDAFHWLPRLARRGDRFDLVVLDPPSYSRVKNRRFSAAHDYADLVAVALAVLAPGGTLLACTNCAGIDRKRFHQMVLDGAHLAGRRIAGVQHRPTALDHPGGRMKSLIAKFE